MTDIQTPPNGKDDDNPSTSGRFNYLDSSVAGSLYRNGAVLVRRDADGSDNGFQGLVLQEQSMTVHDARAGDAKERPTLLANGFELLARPLGRPESGELDFFNHRDVTQTYYSECADIIQEATGAAFVAAFDHNVRSAVGKRGKRRIQGGQQVQGPAHMAHGDYTLTSGPDRLRQLAADPSINDTLSSVLGPGETLLEAQRVARATDENGRFAIINLWRSIAKEPVATHPIALCDAQTVKPEDLVVFELHYQDRIGENYFAKHASRHNWYYYPAMTRDEALLIKQWDSAGALARSKGQLADSSDSHDPDSPCTFSFHSAFDDPSTPADAPERLSIEVRCVVLYE